APLGLIFKETSRCREGRGNEREGRTIQERRRRDKD
ncbi:unnamed protein product, partial [Arabidopsis halleri]